MRAVFQLVKKDLLYEYRTKEVTSSMLLFSLIVVVMFGFTFEPGSRVVKESMPGLMWIVYVFSGMIGLNRVFDIETKNDALSGLMLTPYDISFVYFGKSISASILMLLTEFVTLPFFALFYGIPIFRIFPQLILLFLAVTIGFSGAGTIFAAMLVRNKTREFLLPILLFPLVVPILIASVKITHGLLMSHGLSEFVEWIKVIVVFDIIFYTSGYLTAGYIFEP